MAAGHFSKIAARDRLQRRAQTRHEPEGNHHRASLSIPSIASLSSCPGSSSPNFNQSPQKPPDTKIGIRLNKRTPIRDHPSRQEGGFTACLSTDTMGIFAPAQTTLRTKS